MGTIRPPTPLTVTTSGGSVDVVEDDPVVATGAPVDGVLGAALSVGVLGSEHAANAIAPRRSATTAEVRFMRSERRAERLLSGRGRV
jgi:hypothetical protein